jgi:hypothetical protein
MRASLPVIKESFRQENSKRTMDDNKRSSSFFIELKIKH